MKFDGCRWRHEFVPYQSVDRTSNLDCVVHLMNVMFHYVQPEKVIYTRQSRNGRRGSTELLLLLLVLNTLFLFYTLFVFMPLLRSQLPLHCGLQSKKKKCLRCCSIPKIHTGGQRVCYGSTTTTYDVRKYKCNYTKKIFTKKEYNHFQTVSADDTTRSIPLMNE
jgi:hypothetical protein